jgi:uridine kinase
VPHPLTPVLLLGGASGAGKSYLAARYGRPHVELDNFYRQLSEHVPASPLPVTPYGEVDWDHPGTWNRDAAVDALMLLLEAGRAQVPNYSIATSSYAGYRDVALEDGPVVAEGVFVDEVADPLRARGVAVDALYIDVHPTTTAVRRFVRDVRERRKPIPFLLKRGWALFRADRAIRRRYVAAGFRPVSKRRVRRILSSASPLGAH